MKCKDTNIECHDDGIMLGEEWVCLNHLPKVSMPEPPGPRPEDVCQKCEAIAIVQVCSKASDLHCLRHLHRDHDGYMLKDMGVGSDDYVEFSFCVNCGQIQGAWPKKIHGKIVTRETHGYQEGHRPGKEGEPPFTLEG